MTNLEMARMLITLAVVGVSWMFCRDIYRYRHPHFTAMAVIGLMYPLGKFLQIWLIGPGWIRWYIADVGWISCIGILIATTIPFGRTMLDRIKIGVLTATAVAVAVESWQIVGNPTSNLTGFSAAGDWVDMAIFVAMFAVNAHLIARMEPDKSAPGDAKTRPKNKRKRPTRR